MAAAVMSHSQKVEHSNYHVMENQKASNFNLAVMESQGMNYQVCL